MAKLVPAPFLGEGGEILGGSSPPACIPTLEKLIPIYGPNTKLRGPYIWKKNSRILYDIYDGTKWKTCLRARLNLEIKLGRRLTKEETVDHIDSNSANDDPNNLQVLTRSENSTKFNVLRPTELFIFTCPECLKSATKPMKDVKHNRKEGKKGPFCSKSCAGRYSSRKAKYVRGGKPNPNYQPD